MEKNPKKLDNKKSARFDSAKQAKAKPATKETKGKEKMVTEVKAKARFIKVAPRKVRLVIRQLPGLNTEAALNSLKFVHKKAVGPVTKLINSAIANAENNFQLDKKDLYIKKIIANDGPVLKRWKPRAYGRSAPIRKRTSHIELILGVRPGAKKKAVSKKETKKETKPEEVKVIKPEEVKKEAAKIPGKGPEEKGKDKKGFFKKFFRRKAV
jgi:large subunit ribosomal protein L22